MGGRVDRRTAFENYDAVGQVCGHDKVVLYDERRLLCVQDEPSEETITIPIILILINQKADCISSIVTLGHWTGQHGTVNNRQQLTWSWLLGFDMHHIELVISTSRLFSKNETCPRVLPFDNFSGDETLFGIEIRGRLVDEVDIGGLAQAQGNGDALQLSSRQVLNLLVDDVLDFQWLHHIGNKLLGTMQPRHHVGLKQQEMSTLDHLSVFPIDITCG